MNRQQRLDELQAAMNAKRRYEPPPKSEVEAWVLVFEDIDDANGRTVQYGVPCWESRAEYEAWQDLRFNRLIE